MNNMFFNPQIVMPKKSELSFMDGFNGPPVTAKERTVNRAFDWDIAAKTIKKYLKKHPNLVAEAGLQGDWDYTGGVIFEKKKPVKNEYTYLASSWAIPTLIISDNGNEFLEMACWADEDDRFCADAKWDKKSLALLKTTKKK